ncbi:hypothetical protein GLOIN_2v1770960 [Rhizophagus clarus]|uniref:Uncharacterized protein n=1 Tax=Rhizophagus clarus TaxID=94130 RepID=A0A8H3L4R1_9GLOM|nr:hypothetical protein GLOIN_2v1770960 [Rhizophagus clarus]
MTEGGRPREQIWNYYKTSDPDTHGFRSATCNYCPKHWGVDLQEKWKYILLMNVEDVKNYWQESLANKVRNYKRTDNTKGQSDYNESTEPLSIYEQNEIDKQKIILFKELYVIKLNCYC